MPYHDCKVIMRSGVYAVYQKDGEQFYRRVCNSMDYIQADRWLNVVKEFHAKGSWRNKGPLYFIRIRPKVKHAPTV